MNRTPATSTARCPGDEGESDLDLEWSGGVAKSAQIIFVYAGLGSSDTCSNRFNSVWNALEDALTGTTTGVAGSPVAPFVSTSYGFCEQGMQAQDPGFAATIRGWVQTGQTLGVTLVSASGDSGAADCDPSSSTSASRGLAVDVPASIPETTGAGGNEFTGDTAGVVTGNTAAGDPPYWGGSGAGSDTISSALEYIPEEAWNDTIFDIAHGGGFAASGAGRAWGRALAVSLSHPGRTSPAFQRGVRATSQIFRSLRRPITMVTYSAPRTAPRFPLVPPASAPAPAGVLQSLADIGGRSNVHGHHGADQSVRRQRSSGRIGAHQPDAVFTVSKQRDLEGVPRHNLRQQRRALHLRQHELRLAYDRVRF